MSDLVMFVLFFLADVLLGMGGVNAHLLLLVPPYLFIRNYSSTTILYGGGLAAFMTEIIHQQTLGSLMLGVGLGLFCFHWFLDVINWQHLAPQSISLFLFFLIVVLTRVGLLRVLNGQWILPAWGSYLMTFALGFLMLLYRFYSLNRRSRHSLQ
jgi:hypothetical protein